MNPRPLLAVLVGQRDREGRVKVQEEQESVEQKAIDQEEGGEEEEEGGASGRGPE